MATKKEFKFEDSLKQLQNIIEEIEQGKIGIDEIVLKFQEGKELINSLTTKLNEIEQKVSNLDNANKK